MAVNGLDVDSLMRTSSAKPNDVNRSRQPDTMYAPRARKTVEISISFSFADAFR